MAHLSIIDLTPIMPSRDTNGFDKVDRKRVQCVSSNGVEPPSVMLRASLSPIFYVLDMSHNTDTASHFLPIIPARSRCRAPYHFDRIWLFCHVYHCFFVHPCYINEVYPLSRDLFIISFNRKSETLQCLLKNRPNQTNQKEMS
jgi:phenylpropionate dioxygenase-like ring-hydroxylating dioxygenase large terminal subunit